MDLPTGNVECKKCRTSGYHWYSRHSPMSSVDTSDDDYTLRVPNTGPLELRKGFGGGGWVFEITTSLPPPFPGSCQQF